MPLHDVDLFGIYVTPASVCFGVALAALFLVRALLDRLDIDRFVWNRALFDLTILVAITSALILSLRFGGV